MGRGWRVPNVLAAMPVIFALMACGRPIGTVGSIAPTGTGGNTAARTVATPPPLSTATRPASPPPAVPMAVTTLTVAPAAAPGGTAFTIAGAGFTPNRSPHLVGWDPDGEIVLNRPIAIAADGAVRLDFNSLGRAPGSYTLIIGADPPAAAGIAGGEILARRSFTITGWGPIPTPTLEPPSGPCSAPEPALITRGRNFPPDTSFFLYVASGARMTGAGRQLTGADGTFAVPVRPVGCGPATPDGARFRIVVPWLQRNVDPRRELASATFTVAAAAPPLPLIPNPSPDPR